MSHIRRVLASNHGFYAPTHIQLTAEVESDAPPFTPKTVKTKVSIGKRKGKGKEVQDENFEEERAWLLLKDVPVTQAVPAADDFPQIRAPGDTGPSMTEFHTQLEEDGGLECGCCFSPAPFVCFPYPQHSKPTNPFTAQHDTMSRRPLILHGMHGCLRLQPPWRAQFQDRLYGPIRMQAAISRIGTQAFPHLEASILIREGQTNEGGRDGWIGRIGRMPALRIQSRDR